MVRSYSVTTVPESRPGSRLQSPLLQRRRRRTFLARPLLTYFDVELARALEDYTLRDDDGARVTPEMFAHLRAATYDAENAATPGATTIHPGSPSAPSPHDADDEADSVIQSSAQQKKADNLIRLRKCLVDHGVNLGPAFDSAVDVVDGPVSLARIRAYVPLAQRASNAAPAAQKGGHSTASSS